MDVTTRPLTPDRWDDLEAVFRAKGCSMARGCWCMYYRETGRVTPPAGVGASEDRRRRLQALAAAEPPVGLLAYEVDVPVGWVAVAPRSQYPRLVRSPVAKAVDDLPVRSVVCFAAAARAAGDAQGLRDGRVGRAWPRRRNAPCTSHCRECRTALGSGAALELRLARYRGR